MKKLIQKNKYEFCNRYFADDNGHIWSEYKQDYLSEQEDKNGYQKVTLMTTDKPSGKGHRFSVHRLILETFNPVENMQELQVDHINGDIKDNRLENLRWTTCIENLNNENTKYNRRVYDQDGINNTFSKFILDSLVELIKDCNSGQFKRKEILSKYDICDETLRKILNRTTYKKETENLVIEPCFISDNTHPNYGEHNGRSKLTDIQRNEIKKLLLQKIMTQKEIAKLYNVSVSTISRIKSTI